MKGRGKGSFIAHQSQIEGKLSEGWPIKMVWQHFKDEGTVELSYETFRGYVNSIIGYRPYKNGTGKSLSTPEPARADKKSRAATPEALRATPAKPKESSPSRKTVPNFATTESSPQNTEEQKQELSDGPVMVSTFGKDKPIRPGNKGMALDDDELY
ncbi:TraK family protein [Microbulbifer aggregans]|uniref:TraK family protein n=1 Tax=Microbulbifer aggregans TaxID=1769779 RepID=UPI001CFDB180|nr:TraK family protein [Microbulbifer aggregans]